MYLNPTAIISLGARTEIALAPNLLTGAELNVPQLMQDIYFSAAVAPVGKITWVNPFGFELFYSRARRASLILKRTRAQTEQKVTLDSEDFKVGLFMRPKVNWRFFSRIGARLDVLANRTDTLKFGQSQFAEFDPQVKQTLTTKGLSLALTYEANPYGIVFVGVDFTVPLKRQLVAKSTEEQSGVSKTANDTGFVKSTDLSPYLSLRFPFGARPRRFALEAKGYSIWRQDVVTGLNSVLGTAGQQNTQTGLGGLLGVSFTH